MTKTMTKTPKPGTRGSDIAHPVDQHVGQRIKLRRILMGMTQGQLADAIGLTFQQIQKYERGANRVSASKLWELGNILEVTVQHFYEDMPQTVLQSLPGAKVITSKNHVGEDYITLHRRQSLELVRCFSKIDDPILCSRLIKMVRAITGIVAPS